MMKKKVLKIIAFVVALALIVGIAVFANALVGNPISKLLAQNSAEKHLEKHYADTDFYVESVSFSFKDTRYHAYIKSPSSIDSHFSLYMDMLGRVEFDFYENDVLEGWNTADRIGADYRKQVDAILDSPGFPYTCDIGFGDIEFIPEEYAGSPDVPSYALHIEDLEIDGIYNLAELGAQAGHLVLYVTEESITVDRAAEIMLDVRRIMDEAGVGFYAMDFVLEYPRNEDGTRNSEDQIDVNNFLYEDIYEEGMVERIAAADKATKEYYAEMDKLKFGE